MIGEAASGASGTTLVVTNAGSAKVGGHIVAVAGWNDNTVTGALSDTDGDTFQQDDTATNGSNVRTAIYSAAVAGTFNNGDSVTLTLSAAATRRGLIVYHVDDIDEAARVDENGRATGSSTTVQATLDVAADNADTLTVMGGCMVSDGSLGWTPAGTGGDVVDAGTNRSIVTSYRYRASAAAHTEGGTADVSGNFAAVVVAYKRTTGGATVQLAGTSTITLDGTTALADGKRLAGTSTIEVNGTVALRDDKPIGGSSTITVNGTLALDTGGVAIGARLRTLVGFGE